MPMDWDEAVAYALSLPMPKWRRRGTAKPAVKVNGRAFLTPGHEAVSCCVAIDRDTI
jgi:hypothetical protein